MKSANNMAKREYIQANKEWLEAKAKEEGVKALPKGIYYKVLSSSTAAVAVYRWLADFATSSRAGLSPFSRCTSVTSGNFTSLQKWATVSSLSLASPVARHLSLKLNS